MNKNFLICYDIADPKRLTKVRKVVYEYAIGGQKSAIEAILNNKELKDLVKRLEKLIDKNDRINIISCEGEPVCFGKADFLRYEKGVILI